MLTNLWHAQQPNMYRGPSICIFRYWRRNSDFWPNPFPPCVNKKLEDSDGTDAEIKLTSILSYKPKYSMNDKKHNCTSTGLLPNQQRLDLHN